MGSNPKFKTSNPNNTSGILGYLLRNLKALDKKSSLAGVKTVSGDLVDNTDPLNPAIIDAPSDGNQYARQDGAWEQIESSGGVNKEYYALVTVNSSGVPSLQQLRNTTGITFTAERNATGYHRFTASSPVLSSGNAGFSLQDSNVDASANNPYVRGQISTSSFLDVTVYANNAAFYGADMQHEYYIKIELMS